MHYYRAQLSAPFSLNTMSYTSQKIEGVGLGLRNQHFQYIIENKPDVPWFEVLADNFINNDGPPLDYLQEIKQHYPMVLHSVGMSIGSTDPLNQNYFKQYKKLVENINPPYVSDHLCWISIDDQYFHDLLPLPYTEPVANYVAKRIQQIQDLIGYPLIIENVSSYLTYKESKMPEWEFLSLVAEKANCGILLDINNIYVSSVNHKFDPEIYINAIDPSRVKQFHLAGYTDRGTHLIDTHSDVVSDPVWELYKKAAKRFKAVPTLIEWDADIPEFSVLEKEAERARTAATTTRLRERVCYAE